MPPPYRLRRCHGCRHCRYAIYDVSRCRRHADAALRCHFRADAATHADASDAAAASMPPPMLSCWRWRAATRYVTRCCCYAALLIDTRLRCFAFMLLLRALRYAIAPLRVYVAIRRRCYADAALRRCRMRRARFHAERRHKHFSRLIRAAWRLRAFMLFFRYIGGYREITN